MRRTFLLLLNSIESVVLGSVVDEVGINGSGVVDKRRGGWRRGELGGCLIRLASSLRHWAFGTELGLGARLTSSPLFSFPGG